MRNEVMKVGEQQGRLKTKISATRQKRARKMSEISKGNRNSWKEIQCATTGRAQDTKKNFEGSDLQSGTTTAPDSGAVVIPL